ncbi:HNH endonuclease [Williamsia sterculiae]
MSGAVRTTLDDLILLCANCHVMTHRGATWKTPDELRDLVDSE